jgi:hypothetical protein
MKKKEKKIIMLGWVKKLNYVYVIHSTLEACEILFIRTVQKNRNLASKIREFGLKHFQKRKNEPPILKDTPLTTTITTTRTTTRVIITTCKGVESQNIC